MGTPTRGLVKGNICYNSGAGSGIYSDGGGDADVPDNIIIEENICYDNAYCGVDIGEEHNGYVSGGHLVRRNLCYGNGFGNPRGAGFWIGGGGADVGGIPTNIKVYNNVSYQNNLGSFFLGNSSNLEFKNNISYESSGPIPTWQNPDFNSIEFDYNCWFGTPAPSQAGPNHIAADPLFVDADNMDFHLQDGSPCINAGIDVGDEYVGAAPDIGAFEFGDLGTAIHANRPVTAKGRIVNYPNPFYTSTQISYATDRSGKIDIGIYDSRGHLVRTLFQGMKHEGNHTVHWDSKDNQLNSVPGGNYVIRLSQAGQPVTHRSITLLK
ncbi:FlgD immunoglobulin-like domain containing protein [Fibrobacterota bacterium]